MQKHIDNHDLFLCICWKRRFVILGEKVQGSLCFCWSQTYTKKNLPVCTCAFEMFRTCLNKSLTTTTSLMWLYWITYQWLPAVELPSLVAGSTVQPSYVSSLELKGLQEIKKSHKQKRFMHKLWCIHVPQGVWAKPTQISKVTHLCPCLIFGKQHFLKEEEERRESTEEVKHQSKNVQRNSDLNGKKKKK